MARTTFKNLKAAQMFPFKKRFGLPDAGVDHDFDNDYVMTWANASDTASIPGIGVDSSGNLSVGGQVINGLKRQIVFQVLANAEQGTQAFFVADRPYTITGITEMHGAAATTSGAVTATITKDASGVAPGAGVAVMSSTFNLKATANTVQSATIDAVNPDGSANAAIVLAAGDRLSFLTSTATLTSLLNVEVTVTMIPGGASEIAPYYVKTNGRLITQNFFLANRPMIVTGVYAIWSTAFAAAVTVDITKDTSTNAPGAGTSILLAAMDGTSTANVPLTPALAASAATLRLAAGDRLSVKYSATTTGVGVVIVVTMQPASTIDISYAEDDVAAILSSAIFTADRDYDVWDASATWKTASGTSGTIDFTIESGTTAAGGGTSCLTGTIDATATAETPLHGTLGAKTVIRMIHGDRLSIKFAGTLNGLRGVVANVTLMPR